MNENIYDYVITSVENPAFEDNIAIMVSNITDAEGTSPTFVKHNGVNGIEPMPGTKAANGKIQLHFRLREKLNESELIAFLEQGMGNPKPPITVCSIRSAFKVGGVYDVIMQANKATFLSFMSDVIDDPEADPPTTRPPNMTDDLYLSGYYGTDSIALV